MPLFPTTLLIGLLATLLLLSVCLSPIAGQSVFFPIVDSSCVYNAATVSLTPQVSFTAASPPLTPCDDCGNNVAIGFPFTFYGITYTIVSVSSNGNLQFNALSSTYTPSPFPGNTGLVPFIAYFFTDLYPTGGVDGTYLYNTIGVAPNRAFIVRMNNVRYYSGGVASYLLADVLLYEGSNEIEFRYYSVPVDNSHAVVVGVEGAGVQTATSGYDYIQIVNDIVLNTTTAASLNNTAYHFTLQSANTSNPFACFTPSAAAGSNPTVSSSSSTGAGTVTAAAQATSSTGTVTAAALASSSTGSGGRSSMLGDPMLVGFRGQRFQVHGIDGAVYNLITERQQMVNARFGFLNGPRHCPPMPSTGQRSAACWTHPGSYLTEVAIAASSLDGREHRLLAVPGNASLGFTQVLYDGAQLTQTVDAPRWEGAGAGEASLLVKRLSSHELAVNVGHFALRLESVDGFINIASLEVTPPTTLSTLRAHGLLGQTWSSKRHEGPLPEIEGDVDDYLVTDDDVFGTLFPFNRFEVNEPTALPAIIE